MKLFFLLLIPCFFLLSACDTTTTEQNTAAKVEGKALAVKAPVKLLRHIVLFNFNDSATAETVKKIEEAFAGLPAKIAEIQSFEWGINNSPEGLDKGLTHCFLVTFASEADRAVYLPHPAHQEFVKFIGPYVEDVTVVDYWTE